MSATRCDESMTAEVVCRDVLHEHLQELSPRERVRDSRPARRGQEVRALGEGHGEGELSALAAGQLPRVLSRIKAEPLDPVSGSISVPPRVQARSEPQVIGDAQRGVVRRVLSDEADAPEGLRVGGRWPTEHLDRS